jgi:glycosyltransferase involved in cell wall biosynthesis
MPKQYDKKIDVIVLTRNSDRMLKACFNSIYANIPISNLIVVDGYSTDNTLCIIEQFNKKHNNVILIQDEGTRGKCRQIGIERVETEWFMFVDSDVVLCNSWFDKASRYFNENVGAIYGAEVIGNCRGVLKHISQIMTSRNFDIRGACHDILIRTSAVEGIHIPPELHTLEDSFIKKQIISNGFKIVTTFSPFCRHYKTIAGLSSRENIMATIRELKDLRTVQERLLYGVVFALLWHIK